jgi:hypothetical protein
MPKPPTRRRSPGQRSMGRDYGKSSQSRCRASGRADHRTVALSIASTTGLGRVHGLRAGLRDAKQGRNAFLWSAFFEPGQHRILVREAWRDIGRVFVVAFVLGQYLRIAFFGIPYNLSSSHLRWRYFHTSSYADRSRASRVTILRRKS